MAYVNGFEHDVFISYAHGDNESGWVRDVWKTLKSRVGQYLGSRDKLSFWFDERGLEPNHLLDASIPAACGRSAILVCVVTPSYLNSTWCGAERLAFLQKHGGHGIGADAFATRIFKIVPLEFDSQQPEPLSRLRGIDYFENDPPNGWLKQFVLRDQNNLDQRFMRQTDVLAEKIAKALKELCPVAASPSPPPAPVVGNAVYVAECADDADDDRRQLTVELAQFKIPFLPGDASLPRDEFGRLESAINSALEKCRLSVHILGSLYGQRLACDPTDQKRSLPQLQYQLAGAAGVPRVVWLPDAIAEDSIRSEQQRQFVDSIKSDQSAHSPVQYLRGSLEALKSYVRDKFPPAASPEPLPGAAPVVFISAHTKDASRAEVRQILECCRRRGCDAYTTGFGLDDEARAKREKSYLSVAQGFVLLYTGADPEWVVDRVLKISKKSQSLARRQKSLVSAVVDAPPPPLDKPKPEELFTTQSVMVLDANQGVDPKVLDPFFDRILRQRPR